MTVSAAVGAAVGEALGAAGFIICIRVRTLHKTTYAVQVRGNVPSLRVLRGLCGKFGKVFATSTLETLFRRSRVELTPPPPPKKSLSSQETLFPLISAESSNLCTLKSM